MGERKIVFAGLDAGSVSVKLALLDIDGNILETRYVRHMGNPLGVAYELLSGIDPPYSLGITGSAGRLIAHVLGIEPVNEIVAQSYSTKRLYPQIRTIFEMGGEDSKLILLENGKVKDFSMNSVCAAGTGSFLDQQAERLRLSIEEFGEVALRSKTPPRIAGRCSVFAKSDMIHLQQIATPLEDIVAGLCFAMARNFKGSICKNMELPEPISFQGGVAANKGVIRAFKEVFGVKELIIPEHFALMPAIGAALKSIEDGRRNTYDLERLRLFITSQRAEEKGHEPLINQSDELRDHNPTLPPFTKDGHERIRAYLGIDVGSISTNLAVIDEEGRLLAKRYLWTAGRPIEAVRQGLAEIGEELGDEVQIIGVGTTGSGRYMTADLVGADIVKNEITAQATAAIEIDPEVDTIFEIGGQDSKFISLRDGMVVDFEMNKACAAGTGSFLEEQAEKLGISIKEEFSELAFQSKYPCALGERCTVFMENSLLSKQQRGISREDLLAGLSYSIVQNYIQRVVGGKRIGEKIFFQGGVAFNKAVVSAFEKYLNKKVIVPPHHDVTGAIGMALIAMRYMRNESTGSKKLSTNFKGFDLSKRRYEIKSFECKGCENLCEINSVRIEGEEDLLFYGSRCEKYDIKRKRKYSQAPTFPDLFSEREELLTKSHREYLEGVNSQQSTPTVHRARIGIPRIFYLQDFLPFWSALLWELGFEVELSSHTNRQIINKGIENILSEGCFPHKAAHGHIKDLIDKNVDAILVPSFINLNPSDKALRALACPYIQTMPYIAKAVFGGVNLLAPRMNMEWGKEHLLREIHRVLKPYDISISEIKKAFTAAEEAQVEFVTAIKSRGREILSNIHEKAIVIVGRSYNAFDSGINLDIPKKLSELRVFPIPMDYLPLEDIDIVERWPNMYWWSGQKILKAGEFIKGNPDLFALYIGNFSCGPDSFIHRYFKEIMVGDNSQRGGKPFLQIEIDEHSSDTGIITRLEAFLDSISNIKAANRYPPSAIKISSHITHHASRIIYIPRMSDHAFGLAAAFEACGIDAEVMEASDGESVRIGRRYISGKECYPCTITTGDMVKKALSKDFDPERAMFFMPAAGGPCRFGQYNVLHRLVLREIGLHDVPVFSPEQGSSLSYRALGISGSDFTRYAWKAILAIELLIKCLHETRPYEVNKGESEGIYKEYLLRITRTIKSRNGDILKLLEEMQKAFSEIPKTQERRPLIGIIGEIFVRQHAFSNEDIVKKVESLGGEVWLAPIEEWLYYVNLMMLDKALIKLRMERLSKKRMSEVLNILITRFIQKKIEHEFIKPFKGFLRTLKEPSTRKILKNASPYLHKSFEGEAILSIGKAIDFIENGASGIISAIPFGCMPGTIVEALLKKLQQDTDIPCLTIAYDGVETTCSEVQLEAFMHQAKEYKTHDIDKWGG